jgi:hypothetical protein
MSSVVHSLTHDVRSLAHNDLILTTVGRVQRASLHVVQRVTGWFE